MHVCLLFDGGAWPAPSHAGWTSSRCAGPGNAGLVPIWEHYTHIRTEVKTRVRGRAARCSPSPSPSPSPCLAVGASDRSRGAHGGNVLLAASQPAKNGFAVLADGGH